MSVLNTFSTHYDAFRYFWIENWQNAKLYQASPFVSSSFTIVSSTQIAGLYSFKLISNLTVCILKSKLGYSLSSLLRIICTTLFRSSEASWSFSRSNHRFASPCSASMFESHTFKALTKFFSQVYSAFFLSHSGGVMYSSEILAYALAISYLFASKLLLMSTSIPFSYTFTASAPESSSASEQYLSPFWVGAMSMDFLRSFIA